MEPALTPQSKVSLRNTAPRQGPRIVRDGDDVRSTYVSRASTRRLRGWEDGVDDLGAYHI